jgi:hypothetical protein
MMKKTLIFFEVILAFCVLINAHAGETSVPPLINYQGMLTDADGKPMTGTKNLEFNIYDAAGSGTKIWGPQIFNAVPLISGKFNVILGTTDTSGRSIAESFGSKERYLGIKVNNGAELVPRQQILSAPFAIQAEHSLKADVSNTVEGTNLYVNPDDGNVGIGTTTPQAKLHVDGTLNLNGKTLDNTGLTCISVEGPRSGKSDDSPSYAVCPDGYTLTGCSCHSPWDACDGAKPDFANNQCVAYNNDGKGVSAYAICCKIH